MRHGDITFGGSPHGGVRLDFRERVPVGPFRAPALYVTVDDLEGFAAALAERGIQGVDARKRIALSVALRRAPGSSVQRYGMALDRRCEPARRRLPEP